ncbi:MAG: MBL fold metallo-hydrolase [Planctomycetota bacterium]
MATIQFLGAARHVTGSKYLLSTGDKRVLFECGLVQGPRAIANRKNRELGVDARQVDGVVLSHAHIDHSGALPRLVKLGYQGPIHCTKATAELVEVLLYDSAHLQRQDAEHLRRRGQEYEPPYDSDDVAQTVRQLRGHDYHTPFEVVPGVGVEFYDAGHIFGSAMEVITVHEGDRTVRIGFTGDHGRKQTSILRDPERLPPVDALITESTYGDREHESSPAIDDKLGAIVREEMRDGGRILVPAFAVGRTQNLLVSLNHLITRRQIPPQNIWIDSPMAARATKIMRQHPELFDEETKRLLASGRDPFFFDGVRFVADVDESKSLNSVRQGIVISSSGMCEGGRILHHLKQSISRPEDCILTVGYMAEGTLGRRLVDGNDYVNIFGERYRVRCKVRSLLGLSAHADYKELLASLGHLAQHPCKVFVVHGEEGPATRFADRLRDAGFGTVHVPVHGEICQV